MEEILNYIIQRLGVKQVPYKEPPKAQLDLSPYPIDFEYLGRSLHRFPPISKDFKIVNIKNPILQQAVLFSIYGGNQDIYKIKAIKIKTDPKSEPRTIPLNQIEPEQL